MDFQNYVLSYSDPRVVGIIVRVNMGGKVDTGKIPRIEDRTGTFDFRASRKGGNEYAMHLLGHPEEERTVTRDPTPSLALYGLELKVLKNANFQIREITEDEAEEMLRERKEDMDKNEFR